MSDSQKVYIYGLVDPDDGLVHYVGRTKKRHVRLEEHWRDRTTTGYKGRWLADLEGRGLFPRMVVFARVAAEDARAAETEWIERMSMEGHPITNVEARGLPKRVTREAPIPDSPDALLSVRQSARLRGVAHQAITRAIREGRLTAQWFGDCLGIKRADLEEWKVRTPPGSRQKEKGAQDLRGASPSSDPAVLPSPTASERTFSPTPQGQDAKT
jgi:hypothetical protein